MAIAFTNCTDAEQARFKRAMGFVTAKELAFAPEKVAIDIINTADYAGECDRLAPYFALLGLENSQARLAFNPAEGRAHTILINQEAVFGLAAVHAVVTQLIHLANLLQYCRDHGNIYRFDQEQAITHCYYEFLLWSKFQAMKIATRCHALVSWHETQGEAPPADGCYRFSPGVFPVEGVRGSLQQLATAEDRAVWRQGLWDLLEEMSFYFGILAFYQPQAQPGAVDDQFPAAQIEQTIGLAPCLDLYAALKRADSYAGFAREKKSIRQAVLAMQEQGKARFAA